MKDPLEDSRVARLIEAARDKKAFDIQMLDLRKRVTFADFFFICSGNTSRQNQAISDHIEATLKGMQVRPRHVEGYREADWILMDYSDIVVHIFLPEKRTFYDLEKLWVDAEPLPIPEEKD